MSSYNDGEIARFLVNTLLSLRFRNIAEDEKKGDYDSIMKKIPLGTQRALKNVLGQYSANCFEDFIFSPEHPLDYSTDPLGPHVISFKKCTRMREPHHFINQKAPLAVKMFVEVQFSHITKKKQFDTLYKNKLSETQLALARESSPSIHVHFQEKQDCQPWNTFLPAGSRIKVIKGMKSPGSFIFIIETHAGEQIGRELHEIIKTEKPTVGEFSKDKRVQWANQMVMRNASRVMAELIGTCDVSFLFSDDTSAAAPPHHHFPKMVARTITNHIRHNTFREHPNHVSFYHGCSDGKQSYLPSKYFVFSSHNDVLSGVQLLSKTPWHNPVETRNLHNMLPLTTPFEYRPLSKADHKKLSKMSHRKKDYRKKEKAPFHHQEYPKDIMKLLGYNHHNNFNLKVVHIYPLLK